MIVTTVFDVRTTAEIEMEFPRVPARAFDCAETKPLRMACRSAAKPSSGLACDTPRVPRDAVTERPSTPPVLASPRFTGRRAAAARSRNAREGGLLVGLEVVATQRSAFHRWS